MTAPSVPWLPPAGDAGGSGDDPWAEVDVPEVALTPAQLDFLTAFLELPAVPRMRGLGDPIAPFEEPRTGKPPDDAGSRGP